MESNYEIWNYLFKMVLIGDTYVGKTSLFNRLTRDEFREEERSTIGVEFGYRVVETQNLPFKIQLWDTAGQERFKALARTYFRGASGLVFVYDITNRNSFTGLDNWISLDKESAGPSALMLLVGNKSDLESQRQVSTEEGLKKAQELGCKFVETSAKDSINITSAFDALAVEIFEQREKIQEEENAKSLAKPQKKGIKLLNPFDREKYAGCC